MKRKLLVVTIALALCLGVTACSTQGDVALLQTAKGLTDVWISAYDPAANITDINNAFDAAITAVQGYTPKQVCANVVETVNSLGAALAPLTTGNIQAQIALATIVASVDLVASHYSQCTPVGAIRHQAKTANGAPVAGVTPVPKTAAELKAAWKKLGMPEAK